MTINTTGTTSSNAQSDAERSRLAAAKEKVSEKLGSARSKASDAYSAARERSRQTYGSARDRAGSAVTSTRDGIDSNPAAAVIGGLAIGALLAAVLPRSRRETEMLGDIGRRVNETAREAARAAREAGADKLQEAGLTTENAKAKLGDLASTAGEAVKTSATAAAGSVKGSQREPQPL
jgi:ElaB/YqjD/DUF883 family membrane-anchored ribosome-binding protein